MSYLKTKTTKKIILTSLIIVFMWTSIEYGANNFTAYAPPIPDEFNIENNLATASISSLQNYTMTTGYAYNWIDVSGGTELFLTDDGFSTQSLPFDFRFYNETFSTIYLGANGYLSFNDSSPSDFSNDPIPSGDLENYYLIAPFWDDLIPYSGGGSGNITVQSFGTYWVAEWRNIIHYPSGPLVGTFEVVLHESGEIIFNYDYLNYTEGGYTCGLNLGADVQYYNSYQGLNNLTDDFTILFTYEQPYGVFYDIVIDDLPGSLTNWSWAATQPWFGGGSGTPGAPYIIEDQTFKSLAGLACFSILNSRRHFIIDNCTIRNSKLGAVGLFLSNVTNGQVLNSSILNSDTDGIQLSDADGILFSSNEIYNNSWRGIYSTSTSENNTFTGNIFDNNGWYGVEIYGDNNLLYNNYFTNPNLGHAYDSGNNNDWNNTVIGNYWDDYTGYDLDLDGIGDDPYSIAGSAGNFDYLPIWDIKGPITINDFPGSLNNWTWAESQAWCSGSGTELDPYILEDLIVDGNLIDSCISISNSEAYFTIQHCTLNNSVLSGTDAGIYLFNVTNGNIVDNSFDNHRDSAMLLSSSDHNIVSGNLLTNSRHGIYTTGSYNEFIDNEIYGDGTGTGIVIWDFDYNIITENTIKDCWQGIGVLGAQNTTLFGNEASDNLQNGIIVLQGSYYTVLSGNKVENNVLSGIYTISSHESTIEGNIATDNMLHGINLENSDDSIIYDNELRENDNTGIYVSLNSDGNLLYQNYFINNTDSAVDNGANNDWNNTLIGNYWDDYIGYDMDLDGIGDTPYDVPPSGGSLDYLPIWNLQGPIAINDLPGSLNNWTWAASQAWCSGSGTELDPYIIENLKIDANFTDGCISISNSEKYFIIQGCTLNKSLFSSGGIRLLNVTNGNIMNNALNDHGFAAIYATLSDHNVVSGNILNGHQYGIYMYGSYNEILGNRIYGDGTGSGVAMQGSFTNNTIHGNIIENCWQGIYISGADNNTISGNTALKNLQFGIAIADSSDDNILLGNIVVNNTLSGIVVYNSMYNTIEGSVAEGNYEHGISIWISDYATIYDNYLLDNVMDGLHVDSGSSNNLIYRNYFSGNNRHAFDDGANNDWNSTTIGNYWSNHTGPDTSPNDGIVDNPYTFIAGGAGSIDYLPIAEDGPPSIVINSPSEDDVFGTSAPSFSVTITDTFLDDMWYTIDGGLHNYTFTGSTGTIDQSVWGAMPNGAIVLTFYALDLPGNVGSATVNIEKDTQGPLIVVNSPHTDDTFGVTAPSFIVEISDDNLDSMWYSLDGGTTTFLFVTNGTIDQAVWSALSDGPITIFFYANDTVGNLASESVNIEKDSLAPIIVINSPHTDDTFGASAPSFVVEISDANLDSMWYSLDGGITNFLFTTNGTIDQAVWSALSDGPITIFFYANDTVGNLASESASIDKDSQEPIITINSPNTDDIFGVNAPSFSVTITDTFLDVMWYTIDGGLHNYSFTGSTGTIDQSAWDAMSDGLITLKFYASDIPGNMGTAEVSIEKNSQAPLIVIISPQTADIFSASAPSFVVEISDDDLDSMWYSLDGGTTNFLFTDNSTINQAAWTALAEGTVTITFYANDTLGNLASESVDVVKSLPPPEDNFVVIIIIVISIVAGVAVVTVVLLLRRRKAGVEV